MRCSEVKEILYVDQAPKGQDFGAWLNNHPEVQRKIMPIDKKWAEIICTRKFLRENNPEGAPEKVAFDRKRYRLIICIDPKSKYAGNIYGDDTSLELRAKFLGLTIWRAYHAVGKVFYHVVIGIAFEIFEGLYNKEPPKEISKRVVKQIVDVFRTPYYEALLGGAALVAVIGGIFKKTLLYDCRAFSGYQLNQLFRGERSDWDGSPCMRRIVNIMALEKPDPKNRQKLQDDTYYKHPDNLTLVGLSNLVDGEKPLITT